MTLMIVIEGGHKRDAKDLTIELRRGFRTLFERAGARAGSFRPDCVGSGEQAIADYARHRRNIGARVLLLKDAEGPVPDGRPLPFLQLKKPSTFSAADEHQVFLMVQLMESWFLADRKALVDYYGEKFHARQLKGSEHDIEAIRKEDVENGLHAATRETRKGRYDKGRHSADLLSRLRPDKIEAASPHAKRFFDRLRQMADT